MFSKRFTINYFSKAEIALWCASVALIVLSFGLFDRENYLTLLASLIGVTSLIFNAKGNPFGQFLMVLFSLLYGVIFMWIATILVTILFYFILDWFDTANMIPSTISVTTSFLAVYLTFRRSPYFALAYASNDMVLIVLWVLASLQDIQYVSVVVCFVAFLFNDIYGFVSWRRMEQGQRQLCDSSLCVIITREIRESTLK